MGIAVFSVGRNGLRAARTRAPDRARIVPIVRGAPPAPFYRRRWRRSSRRKPAGSRRHWFRIQVSQKPQGGAPGRMPRC
jgi:hypothetical protein